MPSIEHLDKPDSEEGTDDLVPAIRIARELGIAPQTVERAALRGHVRYVRVMDVLRFSMADARAHFGDRGAA